MRLPLPLLSPLFLPLILTFVPPTSAETSTPNTGDQPQGFTFGFTSPPSTSSLILPITPSCPSPFTLDPLSPTSGQGTADPAGPYTMVLLVHEQLEDGAGIRYERMYARSMGVGEMSVATNFSHPWMTGTQFISCIWAANNVSGGCQDLFTIVDNAQTSAAYANATSSCRGSTMGSWVTPPSKTLDVDVVGQAGAISENSWPAACSDLQFTINNGTPPFTVLVAAAQHPPVNITSPSTPAPHSLNYTIRLTHGQAFAVGVFDSAGNSFMIGPMHSGASEDLTCLAVATGQKVPGVKGQSVGQVIAEIAGGSVGGVVLGALGAVVVMWGMRVWERRRQRVGRWSTDNHEELDPYHDPQPLSLSDEYTLKPTPFIDVQPLLFTSTYGDGPHGAGEHPPRASGSGSYDSDHRRPMSGDFEGGLSSAELPYHYDRDLTPTPGHGVGYGGDDESGSMIGTTGPGTGIGSITSARHSHGYTYADPYDGSRTYSSGRPTSVPSPRPDSLHSGVRASSDSRPLSHQPHNGPHQSPHTESSPSPSSSPTRPPPNVYVVHSDAGGADLHIQLPHPGAQVYELPPDYPHGRGRGGDSRQMGPRAPRPSGTRTKS